MWIVRIITFALCLLPFFVPDGKPLLVCLLFFPAIACSMGVAHAAAEHEDEEETDFVGPVFVRAAKESVWVLCLLIALLYRANGAQGSLLDSLTVLVPSAVFALAGCHVGVLFTGENMSRQAEAFGAAALTTAYLVIAVTGLYLLLESHYASLGWPVPVCLMLVAGAARGLARFVAGPIRIGSGTPVALLTLAVGAWSWGWLTAPPDHPSLF